MNCFTFLSTGMSNYKELDEAINFLKIPTTRRLAVDKTGENVIRENILKNSPEKNDDFFVVPKVVE